MKPGISPKWLLLSLYFAVESVNAPAGIGRDRRATNRHNAQLALVLLSMQAPILAFGWLGLLKGWPKWGLMLFLGVLLCLPMLQWVSHWISGKREAEFRQQYGAMPRFIRAAWLVGTAILVVAAWLIVPTA